ncbi:hypothetical protein DENSPDRAFT_850706 [Dentipellis sp. KUC8613]|nr:hypothetical protein DENSPDRAFT_850706 [Dentipellis sp. KUC8613]
MSNWSLDSQNAGVLCSALDPGPTIPSSPAPVNIREGIPHSLTTSPAKPKRRRSARLPVDQATFAAENARLEQEWLKVQREWGCYPQQARPRSRREELQKLPALCNDFDSFEKQMARLDGQPDDQDGLVRQIRDFLNERKRALERQQAEAKMKQNMESVNRTRQGVEDFRRESDIQIKQLKQIVHANGLELQQIAHRADQLVDEVSSNPCGGFVSLGRREETFFSLNI